MERIVGERLSQRMTRRPGSVLEPDSVVGVGEIVSLAALQLAIAELNEAEIAGFEVNGEAT